MVVHLTAAKMKPAPTTPATTSTTAMTIIGCSRPSSSDAASDHGVDVIDPRTGGLRTIRLAGQEARRGRRSPNRKRRICGMAPD
jgi:hypothetical protein